MLRMTTWGNSRTWPSGKYTGRFSYPMLLALSKEANGPRRKWAQCPFGVCCWLGPMLQPHVSPYLTTTVIGKSNIPEMEVGLAWKPGLSQVAPRNTDFALYSKSRLRQREVTRSFSSLLWASPWSLQCSPGGPKWPHGVRYTKAGGARDPWGFSVSPPATERLWQQSMTKHHCSTSFWMMPRGCMMLTLFLETSRKLQRLKIKSIIT